LPDTIGCRKRTGVVVPPTNATVQLQTGRLGGAGSASRRSRSTWCLLARDPPMLDDRVIGDGRILEEF
jgi:hypothetical protein